MTGQMIAHSLHRQFNVPVFDPALITDHQRYVLEKLSCEGASGIRLVRVVPNMMVSLVLPVRTRSARAADDQPVPQATEMQPKRRLEETQRPTEGGRLEFPSGEGVGESAEDPTALAKLEAERLLPPTRVAEQSPYEIDIKDQLADPFIIQIKEKLKDPKSKHSMSQSWKTEGGLLYFIDLGDNGQERRRLCVPHFLKEELMHISHHTVCGPGHRAKMLYPELANSFWWPRMKVDCEEFVANCGKCGGMRSVALPKVTPGDVPMPSMPMETLHIDYKSLPVTTPSGYSNILVVVCALTRYAIFIPTKDKTAATTLRALIDNVFCVFGLSKALKVVHDNGPEFKNELAEECGKYLGFRRIAVLPYTPTANGVAEASVKRIRDLLQRHTNRYRDWDRVLPLAQYALNTSFHHGIKRIPFEAMFGRLPVKLSELENPDLTQDQVEGSRFIESLRERIRFISKQIKEQSDQIREVRRLKRKQAVPENELTVEVGDVVYALHGNKDQARRTRKSGRGIHWRYRYKVIAVQNFSVKLEAIDNSPELPGWQPLHKISKSPTELNDDHYSHIVDPSGLKYAPDYKPGKQFRQARTPFEFEEEGAPPDEDGYYRAESILKAKKCGNRWMVLVKWEGWAEPTWEYKSDLLKSAGKDVQTEVKHAIAGARGHPDEIKVDEFEYSDGTTDEEDDAVEGTEEIDANTTFTVNCEESDWSTDISYLLEQSKGLYLFI